jgi:hypothetical protein
VTNPSTFHGRSLTVRLFALLCQVALLPSVAVSQGTFAGSWTIRSWQPAPWLAADAAKAVKAEPGMIGAKITFSARRVSGPRILVCDKPEYEIKDAPLEGLFEGGLTDPSSQGAALGFKPPVKTLVPGCEFEFHLRDPNTAIFALSNVLYTIERNPSASK